jgi:hypothetical protein
MSPPYYSITMNTRGRRFLPVISLEKLGQQAANADMARRLRKFYLYQQALHRTIPLVEHHRDRRKADGRRRYMIRIVPITVR